jgi:hypothetical protein
MKFTPMQCPTCRKHAIGTVETLPGVALFLETDAGIPKTDANGALEYSGETKIFWEGQMTEIDADGNWELQCEEGHSWLAKHIEETQETEAVHRVWFDFGNGPVLCEKNTAQELGAFIDGIGTAAEQFGLDDYRQYDDETEAILNGWIPPAMEEIPAIVIQAMIEAGTSRFPDAIG